MRANEQTAGVAATTPTANENLSTGISTPNPSGSLETATKPPRPLLFHTEVNRGDPDTTHTLCGITWPRRRTVGRGDSVDRPGTFCDDCRLLEEIGHELRSIEQSNVEIMAAMKIFRKYLGGGEL
jgi:hypothetical protein